MMPGPDRPAWVLFRRRRRMQSGSELRGGRGFRALDRSARFLGRRGGRGDSDHSKRVRVVSPSIAAAWRRAWRAAPTIVRDVAGGWTLVTKGAPETVLDRCVDVPGSARAALASEFAAGNRVVAVATRAVTGGPDTPAVADERDLTLLGLLVFLDPSKRDAAAALRRLATCTHRPHPATYRR